jgi:hypothetical protein
MKFSFRYPINFGFLFKRMFLGLKAFLIYTFLFLSSISYAQHAFYTLDPYFNVPLERFEIKSGRHHSDLHLRHKPLARELVAVMADSMLSQKRNSKVDSTMARLLQKETWEFRDTTFKNPKAFWNTFYTYGNDTYSARGPRATLHISPVFYGRVGKNTEFADYEEKTIITNSRGVELFGSIHKKLGFYTFLTENIIDSPNFLSYYYKNTKEGYPYQGLIKIVNDDAKLLKADYFSAMGYLRFTPIRNLGISLGHDRNFVGSGLRSMILSDFSVPYLNVKLDLTLGKIQFLNILGQMTNTQGGRPAQSEFTYPPKYMVFHSLSFHASPKVSISLFEQIYYGKRDAGFELNYLNPIIFYRFVESNIGSSDNALIGADLSIIPIKNVKLYGQFVLDEYVKKEYKKTGSWQRKYAYQYGLKYIDVLGLKNMDFQYEYNLARPFIYSHISSFTNALNYNVPVAHPLGANFKEHLLLLRYQPLPSLFFQYTHMIAQKGEDQEDKNFGGNLLKLNTENRAKDLNNKVGQGLQNNIKNVEIQAQYRLFGRTFLELTWQRRKDVKAAYKPENIFNFGVRWNHPYRQFLF